MELEWKDYILYYKKDVREGSMLFLGKAKPLDVCEHDHIEPKPAGKLTDMLTCMCIIPQINPK